MTHKNTTHGMTKTRFYRIFKAIQARTTNKNRTGFKYYGGKGIKNLWPNFETFKKDMYKDYQKHILKYGVINTTIDRIDSNKHYSKSNCRWTTYHEQNRNLNFNNNITYKKLTLCVTDWAKKLNMSQSSLSYRIKHWSIKDAIERPVRAYPR